MAQPDFSDVLRHAARCAVPALLLLVSGCGHAPVAVLAAFVAPPAWPVPVAAAPPPLVTPPPPPLVTPPPAPPPKLSEMMVDISRTAMVLLPDKARQAPNRAPGVSALPTPAASSSTESPAAAPDLIARMSMNTTRLRVPGPPGELKIWIGQPNFLPAPATGDVVSRVNLYGTAPYALVHPYVHARKVDIVPATAQCIRTQPQGTVAVFKVTPHQSGELRIDATVSLFDTEGCQGTPRPVPVDELSITVVFAPWTWLMESALELGADTWQWFTKLWGAVLALLSGLLLFLLRKKIFKRFGYAA